MKCRNCLLFGNGFDKEHGLRTLYWNFREYLQKYEENFLSQMENGYPPNLKNQNLDFFKNKNDLRPPENPMKWAFSGGVCVLVGSS